MPPRVGPSGRGMSGGFSVEEEDLFNKTGGGVLRQLRKTRNPADFLPVLRAAHKGFDRAYATAPEAARAVVACRAGCGTCCRVPVGVQAHEVLLAAEYIQTHFTPADLEGVIVRAAAHRTAFAGRTMRERAALKTPCSCRRKSPVILFLDQTRSDERRRFRWIDRTTQQAPSPRASARLRQQSLLLGPTKKLETSQWHLNL